MSAYGTQKKLLTNIHNMFDSMFISCLKTLQSFLKCMLVRPRIERISKFWFQNLLIYKLRNIKNKILKRDSYKIKEWTKASNCKVIVAHNN